MSLEPREDIGKFTSLAPCIALRELEGPTFSPPQNRRYMGRARNFGLGWIKDILYTSNDTYSYEGVEMNLRDVGVGLIFFLGANLAQAVYTININQVGPDVVMSGSGSINTSSFSSVGLIGPCLLGDGFIGTNALCIGSDTNGDWYPGALSPGISLPSVVPTAGSSSSGPNVFLLGTELYLPENYVSASPLVNQTTFAGTTLAAIGLNVGTQTLFVPSGDEIIINVGLAPPAAPASIPTLGEYALLGLSSLLAILGMVAMRRQRG